MLREGVVYEWLLIALHKKFGKARKLTTFPESVVHVYYAKLLTSLCNCNLMDHKRDSGIYGDINDFILLHFCGTTITIQSVSLSWMLPPSSYFLYYVCSCVMKMTAVSVAPGKEYIWKLLPIQFRQWFLHRGIFREISFKFTSFMYHSVDN